SGTAPELEQVVSQRKGADGPGEQAAVGEAEPVIGPAVPAMKSVHGSSLSGRAAAAFALAQGSAVMPDWRIVPRSGPMPTLPPEVLRSRIFDGLTSDERQAWAAAAPRRDFRKGDVVARQGDPATHLYLVASGFLKVVQGTADGHEVIVRFVGPGEPFGGVVALDGAAYPVTAMAVEATALYSWDA